MDLNEFVPLALRTESKIDNVNTDREVLLNTLRAFAAIGNVLDIIKKQAFYNKPVDSETLRHLAAEAIEHLSQIVSAEAPLDPSQRTDVYPDTRVFHGIVGIATEATELIEALTESIEHRSYIDRINVGEELGDVNWYQAILLDALRLNGNVVLETVIAKLRKRYPSKFTDDNAINRNTVDERQLLELQLQHVELSEAQLRQIKDL